MAPPSASLGVQVTTLRFVLGTDAKELGSNGRECSDRHPLASSSQQPDELVGSLLPPSQPSTLIPDGLGASDYASERRQLLSNRVLRTHYATLQVYVSTAYSRNG